MLRNR